MRNYKNILCALFLSLISLMVYAQSFKVVTVNSPGELQRCLGEDWDNIDSIVVKGTINKEDFRTLYDCSRLGKLTVTNLEYANVEGNRIPDWAFYHPDTMYDYLNLQRIILPDNIEEIGEYAFSRMYLKKINFPKSLKKLSRASFRSCHWLEMDPFIIPEGITEIPWECFAHCQSFKKLVLPQSLKTLGGFSFYNTRMEEMNLPEGLETIGESAFWGSGELKRVVIPESATNLGLGAFAMTDSLKSINIPLGVTEIPDLFLAYSNEIDSITIPDGVTRIGNNAFQWDYDLGYIKLPSNLKSIGFYAFEATNIVEIVLPETLELIEEGAFFRLELLKKVYCMAKIPPIAELDPNNHDWGPFYWSGKNCTLYVPLGSGDLYHHASGWQDFYQIVETDKFPSSYGITFAPNCKITALEKTIIVNNLTSKTLPVRIYGMNGNLIHKEQVSGTRTIAVLPGIYLVKAGNKTEKVIVK